MGRLAAAPIYDGPAEAHLAQVRPRIERDGVLQGLLCGLQCAGRAAAVVDEGGETIGMNLLAYPFIGTRQARPCILRLVECALARGCDGATAMLDLPGEDRLVVRAMDLRFAAPGLFHTAGVLIQIAGLGLDAMPSRAVLRATLGLTVTEAEVASALACGATASSIARERAISLGTVRSHLKTIFAKTGTKRQATLVALVLQLRGVLPPG